MAFLPARYELERGLLSGEINVDDLPALWNRKMKEYLVGAWFGQAHMHSTNTALL